MTTAYTQQELGDLERTRLERAPSLPTVADINSADRVKAIAVAASAVGMLVHVELERRNRMLFFVNPVVAQKLFENISASADNGDWWSTPVDGQRSENLRIPTATDAKNAVEVLSLATGATGPGMLVHIGCATTTTMLYLPKAIAAELFVTIGTVVEQWGWWGRDMALRPMP